ncbi:MAG: aldolase catalytic domain-containing protein [Bacteroidales bacterium]|jgi:hypothetical protein|nr:aldolase catalytic domain-containing protein [Bacteroidales bacterium]
MIKILDCTLRDGGYVNNWKFDNAHILDIINSLIKSGIELIECGFISHTKGNGGDSTLFRDISVINSILKGVEEPNDEQRFLCLLNYGECDVDKFPECDKSDNKTVSALRLAFHKENWEDAFSDVEKLIEKGYDVFVQPMVSMRYNDSELLELINEFNKLDICSIYIVDSFGSMGQYDFQRLFYLFENNVRKGVNIGYHSHNNLQLAFSNAILFSEIRKSRSIIIDSSVYGMGRGAGNLNTELVADFLNKNKSKKYSITPILDIIESYLISIFREKSWGFSPAHYLSAVNQCHPNYASFLTNKKTLSIVEIEEIISSIVPEKRNGFDKEYISDLYINFNKSKRNNKVIKNPVFDSDLLLIASGPSVNTEKSRISNYIAKYNPITISMNHLSDTIDSDYVFFSNQKRYDQYSKHVNIDKVIVSSNVRINAVHKGCFVIDYETLISSTVNKTDNVTVLFMHFLSVNSNCKVSIAGMDGYKTNSSNNYSYTEYDRITDKDTLVKQNNEIKQEVAKLGEMLDMEFITETIFD